MSKERMDAIRETLSEEDKKKHDEALHIMMVEDSLQHEQAEMEQREAEGYGQG